MGSDVKGIVGYLARGGEMPWLNPMSVRIVGLDVKATAENWFAHCPRAEEEVDEEFLQSIRDDGVRQPIDVYRDGNFVNVLEGRRRVKGARIVWEEQKEKGVPVDKRVALRVAIRRGSPVELFRWNARSHQGRKNLDPIQRAEVILNYQKHCTDDIESAAQTFGCSAATIKSDLQLLDLHAKVQKAVASYELSKANALRLAVLPREEQAAKLIEYKDATPVADAIEPTARTIAPRRRIDTGGPTPQPKRVVDRARTYLESVDRPSPEAKIVLDVLAWLGGSDPKNAKIQRILEEASSN